MTLCRRIFGRTDRKNLNTIGIFRRAVCVRAGARAVCGWAITRDANTTCRQTHQPKPGLRELISERLQAISSDRVMRTHVSSTIFLLHEIFCAAFRVPLACPALSIAERALGTHTRHQFRLFPLTFRFPTSHRDRVIKPTPGIVKINRKRRKRNETRHLQTAQAALICNNRREEDVDGRAA